MDYNTILIRFGFDSSNFTNKPLTMVETEYGFVYEVEEAYRQLICPHCNHNFLYIHSYKWMCIKLNSTIGVKECLRIRRIRYKCPKCGKTHSFKLHGIEKNKSISNFVVTAIKKEFYEIQSFSTIAKRYNISTNHVIRIFDNYTKIIPRRSLPKYMCVDEKHFEGDSDGKYAVVISDFFSGEVVDVLENRQMPYLIEYFNKIPLNERNNVKVFISDMYDGYYTIKNRFFPKSIFVVDLFHVVKLLSTELNRIRIRTYNQYALDNSIEKHFMKSNWRFFLMDLFKIRKNEYYSRKFDVYISYDEIILRCLKLNTVFWDGYNILQELLHYDKYETYSDAERFLDRIISKLIASNDELLFKVASSYKKWKVGIINGLARNQTGKRFSNAIAENNNSHIQKIINVSYGYRSFKRFRARIMLILSYKKTE